MFTERFFRRGDHQLAYAVGPDHGPPLVLLHGVARRWQDFVPLVPALATRWKLLAVDHRGHGRSTRAERYRVVDYAVDAVDFVRENVSEPAVIFGHSLGAMVALAVAAELPLAVRAIVLEDPPLDTLGDQIAHTPYQAMFTAYYDLIKASTPDVDILAAALADVLLASVAGGPKMKLGRLRDPASLRFMARCLVDLDPAVLPPLVAGQWLDGFSWQRLAERVKCPVLLLQGNAALGGMLSDTDATMASALLSRVTHVRVAETGHLLHWQATEATLRLTLAFLESL
ncbi:MAG: alpha/beta hydrolase [Pirellulales bacterium]|nr:alpha/beta hydrolase [Pirellulales bacterium]